MGTKGTKGSRGRGANEIGNKGECVEGKTGRGGPDLPRNTALHNRAEGGPRIRPQGQARAKSQAT